jgi:hypothetical protein
VPVDVLYRAGEGTRSHFRRFRDPVRIVATVTRTVVELHVRRGR